jgi:hypothetical protein
MGDDSTQKPKVVAPMLATRRPGEWPVWVTDSAVAATLAARPVYPRKLTICCNAQVVSPGPATDDQRGQLP